MFVGIAMEVEFVNMKSSDSNSRRHLHFSLSSALPILLKAINEISVKDGMLSMYTKTWQTNNGS